MCSWTGFNIVTRNDITVKQDTVAYLPTINAPATAMSTINKVLKQALKIKESLDLNEIVIKHFMQRQPILYGNTLTRFNQLFQD